MRKFIRAAGIVVLASPMLLFGILIAAEGQRIVGKWSSIGGLYAVCGLLWLAAGPTMLVSGLWVLASLGRNRIPLWIGGTAAVLSGGLLIAGVLTYVVPCSGPA
jgi:hypothetical protein